MILEIDSMTTYNEFFNTLEVEISNHPDDGELVHQYLDGYIDLCSLNSLCYEEDEITFIKKDARFQRCRAYIDSGKETNFYKLWINAIDEDIDAFESNLKIILREKKLDLDCPKFTYDFIVMLKQGFPGMWTMIGEQLDVSHSNFIVERGIAQMCFALEKVYYSQDEDDTIDALLEIISNHPNIYIAQELLGVIYYDQKLWKNSIKYLKSSAKHVDEGHIFTTDELNFRIAWAYGKSSNYKAEEEHYRLSLKENSLQEFTLNNLGYSLFKQGQYAESLKVFDECIKLGVGRRYPYSNKVKSLIALGKYSEARAFIEENKKNFGKSFIDNILKQIRGKRDGSEPLNHDLVRDDSDTQNTSIRGSGLSKQQFTTERMLEDELISKLERGIDVFDLSLRIYEDGDNYGRQFAIDSGKGRIDILAQDDSNHFYVIELKKDSGYDDPLSQTLNYMNWISEHLAKDSQNVFGVICLNSPSKELIKEVRKHPEIKLYEYSLSYKEIL
jgi:tetratricopeptide (TPR) repeat protein